MRALVTLGLGGALLTGCVPATEVPAGRAGVTVAPVPAPASTAEPVPGEDLGPQGEPAPSPDPAEAPVETRVETPWTVTHVVDGDTVDVRHTDGTAERVRVIGIDTPERGECGYREASDALAALVLGREAVLTVGARDDRDRYDRILRYVDVDGQDAGLALLELGLAIARYDSRDGYGAHPREGTYVAADDAVANLCEGPVTAPAPPPAPPADAPGTDPRFGTCKEAKSYGLGPYTRGVHVEYDWYRDGDSDGVVCE